MNYESIILELMNRIKVLENRCDEMEEQMSNLGIEPVDIGEEFMMRRNTVRQKMTKEQIRNCYEHGVALYKYDYLDLSSEISKLLSETPMNPNSAIMYVSAVINMLNGEVYKRAINQTATELYFQYIQADFGVEKLKNAIHSTKLHIKYREQFGPTLTGLVELCNKYD